MATVPSSSLYPVVQDLTEIEYGCCCGDDAALGQFSLKDFALPVNTPLDSYKKQNNSDCEEAPTHRHSRSFSFGNRMKGRMPSSSSHGALVDLSDSQTVTTEPEDRPKFHEVYVLTRQIFECSQSKLWECVHRESGLRYCVKIIVTNNIDSLEEEKAVRREIACLQEFESHRSIVRLKEVLEESGRYHLVMELMTGGNLLSRVVQEEGLPEETIRKIARSLLLGLKRIHETRLSHNDLQPSNILLDGSDHAKIADFGSASRFDTPPNEPKEQNAYTAPEISQGLPCSSFSDMWSVGVILYFCFFGHAPFLEQSSSRSLLRNQKLDFTFPVNDSHSITRYAKQLISSCLHSDPSLRPTAEEALEHPWLVDEVAQAPRQHQGHSIRKSITSFFQTLLCLKRKRPRPVTVCCTSTSSSSRGDI